MKCCNFLPKKNTNRRIKKNVKNVIDAATIII